MARASSRWRSRSRREWAVRGALVAILFTLGLFSTAQTLAYALLWVNPEYGYALAPGDGRVAGALAQQIAAADGADRARADAIARRALVDEPLAATAITALALDLQVANRTAAARRLFLHSDALSRRELSTRLWLIEDAVSRGDVAGALLNYDIALRTAKTAPDLLFPILAEASSDPEIRIGLASKLASRPPWLDSFVAYVTGAGVAPSIRSDLYLRLRAAGIKIPDFAQVSVIKAYADTSAFDDSWAYYQKLHPRADARRSRDPEFDAAPQTPSIFDWTPATGEAGINAAIYDGVFDYSASATVSGVALQQHQFLTPGRYQLSGISHVTSDAPAELPFWQLACIDGRELARVELPKSGDEAARFAGAFNVDTTCKVQILRLVIRPSNNTGGVSGQIDRAIIQLVEQLR